MHLTRSETPRSWPVARKGTKYMAVPSHGKSDGITMISLLRDVMKIAKDRKEVKRILHEGKASVNGKLVRDEKFALVLFDVLDLDGKKYKIVLEHKKFKLEETKDKEKIVKVTGKKILSKDSIQVNFNDGRNIMTQEKISMGDSAALSFDGKIVRKIELKDGAKVIVIGGSHIGEEGKVDKLDEKTKKAIVIINKEKVNLDLERLMAI
jgi:small subunit ribosomal protein S4e